jgi:hypothetical protein
MSTKSTVALSEENKPSRRKFFIGAGATVGAVDGAGTCHIEKHARVHAPEWCAWAGAM